MDVLNNHITSLRVTARAKQFWTPKVVAKDNEY